MRSRCMLRIMAKFPAKAGSGRQRRGHVHTTLRPCRLRIPRTACGQGHIGRGHLTNVKGCKARSIDTESRLTLISCAMCNVSCYNAKRHIRSSRLYECSNPTEVNDRSQRNFRELAVVPNILDDSVEDLELFNTHQYYLPKARCIIIPCDPWARPVQPGSRQ